MTDRLTHVYIVLGVIALIALILSLPYLFPPASIQECKKILQEDGQPYKYRNCIDYVATIKQDKSLCNHISGSFDRTYCKNLYGDVEHFKSYNCIEPDYGDVHICKAIELAEQGN